MTIASLKAFLLLFIPSIISSQLPVQLFYIFTKALCFFICRLMNLPYFKHLLQLSGLFMFSFPLTIFQAKNYHPTLQNRTDHLTRDLAHATLVHYLLLNFWTKCHFHLEDHSPEESLSSGCFCYCLLCLGKQNSLIPLSSVKFCFISTILKCLCLIRLPLKWYWKSDLLTRFIRWLPSYF